MQTQLSRQKYLFMCEVHLTCIQTVENLVSCEKWTIVILAKCINVILAVIITIWASNPVIGCHPSGVPTMKLSSMSHKRIKV
jgi:hypothetical protein